MYKFIVVFYVAVVTSATFAAVPTSNKLNVELSDKDQCLDDLRRVGMRVLEDVSKDQEQLLQHVEKFANEQEARIISISKIIEGVVNKTELTGSVDQRMGPDGLSVNCETDVSSEIFRIIRAVYGLDPTDEHNTTISKWGLNCNQVTSPQSELYPSN